jgi:hypothetical protein
MQKNQETIIGIQTNVVNQYIMILEKTLGKINISFGVSTGKD